MFFNFESYFEEISKSKIDDFMKLFESSESENIRVLKNSYK